MSPPHNGMASTPDLRGEVQRLAEQQARLFARLEADQQHFRHLARSVWRVQEDERRRLARELHDGIGQHLTALRHRLLQLDERSDSADREDARATLGQALTLCETALAETRALSRLLRPQILDDLGLAAALQWLARYSSSDSGLQVQVDVRGLPDALDRDVATLLFRVAQEALANAQKHAQASQIVVRLHCRDGRLTLLVVDDGVGCDVSAALGRASQGESTGLASIAERVRLFDGELSLTSEPGEGLQLRVQLPLPECAS
jgi:two-component system NarL family sensor kinase